MVTVFYALKYLLLMSSKEKVKHTITQVSIIWIKMFFSLEISLVFHLLDLYWGQIHPEKLVIILKGSLPLAFLFVNKYAEAVLKYIHYFIC